MAWNMTAMYNKSDFVATLIIIYNTQNYLNLVLILEIISFNLFIISSKPALAGSGDTLNLLDA